MPYTLQSCFCYYKQLYRRTALLQGAAGLTAAFTGRVYTALFPALLCGVLSASNVHAFDYFQALPEQPLIAKYNPQTAAKIQLGKRLFYDNVLSANQTHACNTCHNLLTGGDDDKALSSGPNGKLTKRSAPGLWNIGLQTVLYWDGRVNSLEEQAIDHLKDPAIMGNNSIAALLKRLSKKGNYKIDFKNAFASSSITLSDIAKALASFQRELMARNSPFDRFIRGDTTAISDLAKKGQDEFLNAGCLACHFGYNFAGPAPGPALNKMGDGFYELFPNNIGSVYDSQLELVKDLGRYEATGDETEKHMWRVPPLRNIALTAPYFHNGSAKTLRMAVKVMGKTQFNKDLDEDQISAIVAFLNTLTGNMPTVLQK